MCNIQNVSAVFAICIGNSLIKSSIKQYPKWLIPHLSIILGILFTFIWPSGGSHILNGVCTGLAATGLFEVSKQTYHAIIRANWKRKNSRRAVERNIRLTISDTKDANSKY